MLKRTGSLVGLLLPLAAAPSWAASVEDQLAARWRAAYVITAVDVFSDCDASYTNNEMVAGRSVGKGRVRFGKGELGQVHKVDLKRARVEILINLDEAKLLSWREGPFELFEEAHCKVELLIDLPREIVKAGNLEALDQALSAVLERHERREEALASARWNRRQREAFPQNYERTVAEHRVWKAEQINGAIERKIHEALEQASYALRDSSSDPEYATGFGAGAEAMKWLSLSSCESWLSSTIYSAGNTCPSGSSSKFRDGFEDGQRVAYAVILVRELRECRLPP